VKQLNSHDSLSPGIALQAVLLHQKCQGTSPYKALLSLAFLKSCCRTESVKSLQTSQDQKALTAHHAVFLQV